MVALTAPATRERQKVILHKLEMEGCFMVKLPNNSNITYIAFSKPKDRAQIDHQTHHLTNWQGKSRGPENILFFVRHMMMQVSFLRIYPLVYEK